MRALVSALSSLAVPILFALVGGIMLLGRRDYFSAFTEGAKSGARAALGLFPTLVGLLAAVTLFRASGLADVIAGLLSPYSERIGIPSELLTLLIARPISGGASNAAFRDLLHAVGADSLTGFLASVIMGAGDTVVYVVTVYYASIGVKKQGKTFFYAFLVMLFGIFFSVLIARLWFNTVLFRQ